MNDREIQELSEAMKLSRAELEQSYTRRIVDEDANGHKKTQVVLQQTRDDRQCIFLKGPKCSVYDARPTQCRTFPWWPQHLVSDYDWRLAAADCEGIHVDEEGDGKEAVPGYSFDDVMPDVLVHEVRVDVGDVEMSVDDCIGTHVLSGACRSTDREKTLRTKSYRKC